MPGGHAGRVWEGQAAWGLTSALPGRGAIPQPSRASVHPGMGALSAATHVHTLLQVLPGAWSQSGAGSSLVSSPSTGDSLGPLAQGEGKKSCR